MERGGRIPRVGICLALIVRLQVWLGMLVAQGRQAAPISWLVLLSASDLVKNVSVDVRC